MQRKKEKIVVYLLPDGIYKTGIPFVLIEFSDDPARLPEELRQAKAIIMLDLSLSHRISCLELKWARTKRDVDVDMLPVSQNC
jgi:hypothetical protein